MTRALLSFFLMCTLLFGTEAQSWFEIGDVWVQRGGNGLSGTQEYRELKIIGDTIVQGMNAKIMNVDYKWVSVAFGGSSGEGQYQRIVREQNDSIFYWNDEEYTLLYNFNLRLNDTIYYADADESCTDSIRFILKDTSQISIGQSEFRVQEHNVYQSYWDYEDEKTIIENVGLIQGHFELPQTFACYTDASWYHLCSFKRGADSLLFMQQPCYDLPVSTQDIEIPNLSLHPNPTKGMLYIETDEQIERSMVYSLDGRLLKLTDFNHSSIDLRTTAWSAGLYIIEIQSKKGNISRKKIYLE